MSKGNSRSQRVRQLRTSAALGRPFTITTPDGASLAVTAYGAGSAEQAIVLASATAVPQRFYKAFASWLAYRGVNAYTFDYRGVARSRPRQLRGFVADYSHWAQDLDAVLAHALAHHSQVSLVGHSIGGFLGPLAAQAPALKGLVLVGAQTAYWRDWPQPWRVPMALLWHGLMPLVTLAVGYFPGRLLRLGEDLPRGVALQWARRAWQDPFKQPDLAALYARALPPVRLMAGADDRFATPAAQQRLQDQLTGAAVHRHTLAAPPASSRKLSHLDVFRPESSSCWPHLLLAANLDATPAIATPAPTPKAPPIPRAPRAPQA
jgi:predicted alpha/beta hydrolase